MARWILPLSRGFWRPFGAQRGPAYNPSALGQLVGDRHDPWRPASTHNDAAQWAPLVSLITQAKRLRGHVCTCTHLPLPRRACGHVEARPVSRWPTSGVACAQEQESARALCAFDAASSGYAHEEHWSAGDIREDQVGWWTSWMCRAAINDHRNCIPIPLHARRSKARL